MAEFKTPAEVVTRLRSTKLGYGTTIYVHGALNNPDGPEAANLIEAQARRIEELAEALQPFAEAATALDDEHRDDQHCWESGAAMDVKAGDFRLAARLLGGDS